MGKRNNPRVFAFDRAKASFKLLEMLQESSRSRVAKATDRARRTIGKIGIDKVDQLPLVVKLRRLGFSTRDELNDLRQQINRLETRLAKLEPQAEPAPQAFPQA